MKWFRHLSNSMEDEKIATLICNHGMEMYGYWWAVLEIVARHVDKNNKCSVAYPIAHWSRLLYTPYQRATNVLVNLEATGLLRLTKEGTTYTVTIDNLLKYRDEYSKKSGFSKNKIQTDSEAKKQNIEAEAEEEKYEKEKTATSTEKIFIDCFAQYENRIRDLYPHADFNAERETCIAHYRSSHPPIDCYPIILKWFQRVPKTKTNHPNRPMTFADSMEMRNQEQREAYLREEGIL